jgi:hypothetical protein
MNRGQPRCGRRSESEGSTLHIDGQGLDNSEWSWEKNARRARMDWVKGKDDRQPRKQCHCSDACELSSLRELLRFRQMGNGRPMAKKMANQTPSTLMTGTEWQRRWS